MVQKRRGAFLFVPLAEHAHLSREKVGLLSGARAWGFASGDLVLRQPHFRGETFRLRAHLDAGLAEMSPCRKSNGGGDVCTSVGDGILLSSFGNRLFHAAGWSSDEADFLRFGLSLFHCFLSIVVCGNLRTQHGR